MASSQHASSLRSESFTPWAWEFPLRVGPSRLRSPVSLPDNPRGYTNERTPRFPVLAPGAPQPQTNGLGLFVELWGIEPQTPSMPWKCSTN